MCSESFDLEVNCVYNLSFQRSTLENGVSRLTLCGVSSVPLWINKHFPRSKIVSLPDLVIEYVNYPSFLYFNLLMKCVCWDVFFPLTDFPWYEKIKTALQSKFKLQKFRSLQLETVNAAMAGKDIFLVMPTGGGKSLCYQLPAVCSDGK